MTLVTITPQKVRASLRNLANGRESQISTGTLAWYLLRFGVPEQKPKNDFVRFAKRLHALPDTREAEGM